MNLTGRLVIVRWRDSAGSSEWSRSGLVRSTLNDTTGYVLRWGKKEVVLASSHSNGYVTWGMRTVILRGSITDVRLVKIGKRVKHG